jgi:hypothetical protein
MSSRRRILIYPRFQLLLITLQLGVIAGIIIPVVLSIQKTFQDLQMVAAKAGLPPTHSFYRLISLEKHQLLSRMTVPLILGVLASTIITIVLSDRLAGPIVRLRGVFQRVAESGETETVSFRAGDFFTDLPGLINRAFDRLRGSR